MPGRPLLRLLQEQVGDAHVLNRPADRAAYAFDAFGASGDRFLPSAVVLPASTEEVAGVVSVCREAGVPVVPRGAGTGYAGGAVALTGGVVVGTARMNRLPVVEPASRRMRVEAGTVTDRVREAAATAGLYYPVDPGSSSTSTIGGNVATNAGGPHALRYGNTGDYVVGATVVLADGRVEQLGEGHRGGDNLLRLVLGSEGTLAIVTEVRLRLLEQPTARATLAAVFPTARQAQDAIAALAAEHVLPAAFEFMDSAALAAVARSGVHGGPLEPVLQQARAGQGTGRSCLVLVEVEGDAAEVAAQADRVRVALDANAATAVWRGDGGEETRGLWAVRRAISGAVATLMIGKVNEDVVVPRDRVDELIAATHRISDEHRVPVVNFGHLGDGNIHCTLLIDPRRSGDRSRADAAAAHLIDEALQLDGVLSGEHGIGYTKLAHLEAQIGSGGVALMRRLKGALDPHGVLNPGKKVPGLAAPMISPEAAAALAAV